MSDFDHFPRDLASVKAWVHVWLVMQREARLQTVDLYTGGFVGPSWSPISFLRRPIHFVFAASHEIPSLGGCVIGQTALWEVLFETGE